MRRSKREGTEKNMDEVEQLLQSVQDQLLLNISINFHIAHASASNSVSPFDFDLDRRFQALKSSQLSNSITSAAANQDQELKEVLGDDLSSRFAALKAKSVPNPNSLTSSISAAAIIEEALSLNDEDEEEEDEVDKPFEDDEDGDSLGDDDERESRGEGPKGRANLSWLPQKIGESVKWEILRA